MTVTEFKNKLAYNSFVLSRTKLELNEKFKELGGIEYVDIRALRTAINALFDCEDVTIEQKIKAIDNYIYIVRNISKVLSKDVDGMDIELEELKKEYSSKIKKYYVYSIGSDTLIISNNAPDIEDEDITVHFITENKERAVKIAFDKVLKSKDYYLVCFK